MERVVVAVLIVAVIGLCLLACSRGAIDFAHSKPFVPYAGLPLTDQLGAALLVSGLFVQLEDPFVEGMIPKESMTDDFYEFNADRMVFFGRRKRRTFKVGDKVKITVVRSDLDRRQIDFGLAN